MSALIAPMLVMGTVPRQERLPRTGRHPNTAGRDRIDAAWYTRERRFAETGFGRIAYVERGQGEAALFLHGFPLNGFQWRGAIERLSGYRRCVAPDFLGLGFTEVGNRQSCAPAAQVAMLTEFLARLGIGAVDLVANDSGGAIAQLFAVKYPGRVRTLLLTNCDVEPDSPPPAVLPVIELARAGRFADEWIVPWVNDKSLARSEKGIGGMTYSYRVNPTDEAVDMYLAPLVASAERKAWLHAYAMGLTPNPLAGIEGALRRLDVPVRILWGTSDDIFSKDSPAYLDRILPRSRGVCLIEGAKLFWPEEFPDIVAEEAKSLWRP